MQIPGKRKKNEVYLELRILGRGPPSTNLLEIEYKGDSREERKGAGKKDVL